MQQMDSQTRLKSLFRELFQLDVADLDFGLYRLFHLKGAEVEAFLNEQLPAEWTGPSRPRPAPNARRSRSE